MKSLLSNFGKIQFLGQQLKDTVELDTRKLEGIWGKAGLLHERPEAQSDIKNA